MSLPDKAALLDDLRERLDRLDCLAQSTKRQLIEMFGDDALSSETLTLYLEHQLTFVEREFASIDRQDFCELCERLSVIEDHEDTLRALGYIAPHIEDNWFWHAMWLETRPLLCLYAAANCFALMQYNDKSSFFSAIELLSSSMRWVGRVSESLRLLETHLGLQHVNYASRDLEIRLSDSLRDLDVNNAANLVVSLADSLRLLNRAADGMRIFESHLGLTTAAYSSSTLTDRFAECLSGIGHSTGADYINALAQSLWFVDRVGDSVQLLEAYLELGGGDYTKDNFAQRMAERLLDIEVNVATCLVITLANGLSFVGRLGDGVRLLEARLGLQDEDFAANGLATKLALGLALPRGLRGLACDNIANLVRSLVDALVHVDRSAHGVRLLEAHLWLRHADYSPHDFAGRLAGRLGSVAADNAVIFVRSAADALRMTGRMTDSRIVLESYLGLSRMDYAADDFAECLAGRLDGLAADNAAMFVRSLAESLVFASRARDAVRLLNSHLMLTRDDYAACDLSDRLMRRLRDLTSNNAASVVLMLADSLVNAQQAQHAERVLDAYCGEFAWLDGRDDAPIAENAVDMVDLWLRLFMHRDRDCVIHRGQQLLPYLRQALRRPGTTSADRKRFARRLGNLRQRMLQAQQYWAGRETNPTAADALRRQAIQTDAELGQRALYEQFVAGEYVIAAPDDGASLPVPGWPFLESSRTWQRFRDRDGRDFDPRCNALAFAAFGAIDDEAVATGTLSKMVESSREPPEWLAQVEQEVAQGIDESRLARVLGRNTLFLRATFDSDGTLRWWAVRSDGERLALLADNLSARSNSLDLDGLRWVTALHDLEVECEYSLARMSIPETLLSDLRCRVDKVTEALSETDFLDGMSRYLREFLQPFNRAVGLSLIPLLNPPSSDSERESWRQRTAVWWSNVVDFLTTLEREAGKWGSAARLDDSTRRYLNQVSEVWKLEPLAKALRDQTKTGADAAEIDLVVQVDDVLHAVPVPHLIVGDRPLFEQVRSCRVSLSVLLDTLQERLELKAQQRQPNSRRMLAVSWFDPGDPADPTKPGDPAGEGAVLLHHLHSQTADEFGLKYLAAAEDPPARRGTLLRALDDEGYCVATILGHGDPVQAGVKLAAKELWNGQGRTLDGVEFLIIPSCSIGRVQQTGVRDVEGFCVTLALHQARSALACRWKVNAAEAPYFADEVARQYLELRKDSSPEIPGACLRARAVNLARKALLANNHRSGHNHVGLNTAAAFELYGRG